jgi:hypothetical protein
VDAGLRQPLANQRRLGLIRRDGHHLELVGHSSKATGPGPLILTRRRP